MNVVLVNKNEVMNDTVVLTDHRAKHIVKVLQAEEGDSIRVGMVHGKLGSGKILGITKKYPFVVELSVYFVSDPPEKSPVDLLLALPRPIMLRRIFSQATALGVGRLHIINANRVEKSFWNSGILEEKEYLTHLLHGLEQAVDTIPPTVVYHKRFKGGWVDYEERKFKDNGFWAVTIGERILKVDTAVVNLHGRIMAEFER